MRGVDPEAAYRTMKTLTSVWEVASERMLGVVARRLARGVTEPGWAESKSREVLLVRAELQAVVARYLADGMEAEAQAALDAAYGIGERVAEQLGEVAATTNPDRVTALVTRFVGQLQGTVVPVIRAHEDVYQRAIQDSESLMATGTIVRREAVAQAVADLVQAGEERFVDRSGRRWHLDAYVRMAGRTAAAQSAVEGQLDGLVARGRDLVVISDSPRECRKCQPWEGKLLSITGGTAIGSEVDGHRVAGTVEEAREGGLWHPNCTHRADVFTPGFTRVPVARENPEGYREQQRLRKYERELRDLKRGLSAVEELGDTQVGRAYRREIRAHTARLAAYAEATGQLRRRERERPVG
ncbi:phage minor capsid protein [Actinosynnema mirum]|uniref:Phage minor capsid protein 2 n=1 Tax=Actinosynnema mirum (strain ATCC 29888 / DSM 43827 / JCM 3225 / NBRC 14064 / NCIMB 13271 / NRRL B-12336 / IMRU 3971 / 101) TaxID=446462 RepID=C6WBN1_ACTMD|nr:phage minor capsid protein [Actinosynnema mirum]ACU35599.1 hypothetical protein Amir_1650 [Actinosynnema mirum DSM 43827]